HYHPRARPVSSARGPARPRARRLSSSRGPSFLRPLLSFHPRRFTTRLPRGGGASGGARASRAAARPRTRPHPGSSKPTPPSPSGPAPVCHRSRSSRSHSAASHAAHTSVRVCIAPRDVASPPFRVLLARSSVGRGTETPAHGFFPHLRDDEASAERATTSSRHARDAMPLLA